MNHLDRSYLGIVNRVRMLWMQHSEWTRAAFAATIFHNPDEEAVVQRLLRNPVDFSDFLICFFGWQFAFSFRELLTEHLSLAVALVRASMANDTAEAKKTNKRLFANADELSALLSTASPYWQYDVWRTMLYRHLNLAIQMASEIINGDYKKSIHTYNCFEAEVMLMADLMVKGLLK
ncbi:MAG: acetylglutamate kinase [Desulfotomaculaceae bacterium]|nr:acetylglutamate kinase [Desulfotomaculaceae bacterium]